MNITPHDRALGAVETRRDGWPFCPVCQADELMSIQPLPSPLDYLRCLRCGWTGFVRLVVRAAPTP